MTMAAPRVVGFGPCNDTRTIGPCTAIAAVAPLVAEPLLVMGLATPPASCQVIDTALLSKAIVIPTVPCVWLAHDAGSEESCRLHCVEIPDREQLPLWIWGAVGTSATVPLATLNRGSAGIATAAIAGSAGEFAFEDVSI